MSKNRNRFPSNQSDQSETEVDTPVESISNEDQQNQDVSTEPVEQEVDTSPEPAAEAQAPVVQEEPVVAKTSQPNTQGYTIVSNIVSEINNFVEGITNLQNNNEEGFGQWRYSLLKTMMTILGRTEQSVFNNEWATLLAAVKNNREKAFNEGYIFRHPGYWKGSDKEFTIFRRLVWLVITTADATTRKAELANVKLDKIAEGLTEAQRNNLISFYE